MFLLMCSFVNSVTMSEDPWLKLFDTSARLLSTDTQMALISLGVRWSQSQNPHWCHFLFVLWVLKINSSKLGRLSKFFVLYLLILDAHFNAY